MSNAAQPMRSHVGFWNRALGLGRALTDALCGMRNYENYLQHQREHHPDTPPLSREQFFKEALDAKYGQQKGKITRCC